MKNRKLINLTYIAMSAAIMAVCSWIMIPMTVAVTLQTFAVLTVSALFGARIGVAATAVYLLLGAVGLPVFSGFQGGIGHLFGAGGGYLMGFVLTALAVGLMSKTRLPLWASMALGVTVCYIAGTLWYAVMYSGGKGLWEIALACVVPFIPFDAVKIAAANFAVKRLKRGKLIK